MTIRASVASIALVATTTFVASNMACAQQTTTDRYDLPTQPLEASLRAVGRISGRQVIIATEAVAGKSAPALHGKYDSDRAISLLLAGSAVRVRFTAEAALVGNTDVAVQGDAITVTGTRIRGARVASPVISIARDDMANAGQASLGDVVRSIPQNFTGGQNPSILQTTAGGRNQNFNSASTINLRGLGPDATLTLLNGHRLSYDGASQAVDISAIPVAAVERIEIVADGASAIYGSDAVGGVANIILRKDYNGVEASARFAGTTDGGGFQQQYSLVAGQKWNSGGVVATYNFEQISRINANQRSYTRALNYSTNLRPFQRQHSGILTGHQSITPDLTLYADATYNHRFSALEFALTAAQPYQGEGQDKAQSTTAYSLAPRLEWKAPQGWLVALSGLYGYDKTNFTSRFYSGNTIYLEIPGQYCNVARGAELSAEWALFDLPGGAVRAAAGGGYRSNALRSFIQQVTPTSVGTTSNFSKSRSSFYGYGEMFLPFITPELAIPGANRFDVTAALRYEDYGRLGNVATPKLGLVFEPVRDIALRATWGKSFKTPTLYQQYSGYRLVVYSPAQVGAPDAPTGSSVLFASGGNPDLVSESATSWTAGLKLQPRWMPGLTLEASYFSVEYRNRINQAGVQLNGALNNALYQQLITRGPDQAAISALLEGADSRPTVQPGATFDPTNVFAFIDSRNLNVSRQSLKGVDIAFNLKTKSGPGQTIDLFGAVSYLQSEQTLLATSPATQLAGLLYNPPHWRARGGVTFADGGVTASTFINHVGAVTDNSAEPYEHVSSMTTVDAVLRYQLGATQGPTHGLTVAVSMLNMFNAKPDKIRVVYALYPAYDSTNYSSVGRLIGLSLSKRW